ncbi:MAG TPA: CRISPR-associated endonuclease Cas1 [candidate division Zixibacteria bacterium]|nr:CRISPR-associated endonuclease Cas1 [candidate division Zixibacteria bacterium]
MADETSYEVPTSPEPERYLPAQYNLFTGAAEVLPIEAPEPTEDGREVRVDEGISLVKSEDGSQLIFSGFGLFLSKKSERLLARKGKDVIYQFPLFRLQEVVVGSKGITVSSDLLQELCVRGVRLSFLDSTGKPYAMVTSPMLTATVQTRREQILALTDRRGLEFSKAVVLGKVKNQERLLRYFGKHIKKEDEERFRKIEAIVGQLRGLWKKVPRIDATSVAEARGTLMGTEGTAGRLYWDGVKEIVGHKVEFFGREHRGAQDAVNSLLNYGYGILYSQVWGAVLNAGLEPFAGFLHVDRPGKPSLVLDLVEEFRQPVVDRSVIACVNLGMDIGMKDGLLDAETRRRIGERIIERLYTEEPYRGKQYQIRSIIQMQARRLAAFLRGAGPYKAFSFKW